MRIKKCIYLKTNGVDCICDLDKRVLGDIMGYDGRECRDCIMTPTVNEEALLIKYHRGVQPIAQIDKSDWVDLRVAEDIIMNKGDFKLIPLGVSIMLPPGYEALVIPRSSTFKKYGIIQANSIGLIDESYCGENDEWMFPAYATRDIRIEKNTRICQFRIMSHQPKLYIDEVSTMPCGHNRGGFGSTGEK